MATIREKIIVVEGDPLIADMISRQALSAAGFNASVASDFETAIAAVTTFQPDAMILDVNLPGMNARDLMMALTTQGFQIPVIALAKKGEEARVIQTFRAGAVDYILWPAHEPEVISVVERAVQQLRIRREREQLSVQLQQRVNDLTTISSIGKAVTSAASLSDLFDKTVKAAVNCTAADLGWLCVLDEKQRTFELANCHNLPEVISKRVGTSWNDGISQQVVKTGKIFQAYGNALKHHPLAALGQSILILPIVARQQVIGTLALMRKEPKPFDPAEQQILESLADYASISLANAYLFHTNEERSRSLKYSIESFQTNQKVSHALVSAVKSEIQATIKKIAVIYRKIMQSDTSQLNLKQQERMVQLNVEISNLSNMADAMSLPLLERPSLSHSRVHIGELLRSELKQMDGVFKSLSSHYTIEDDGECFANCQPAMLGTVLRGVINQALRYTHPGEDLHIHLSHEMAGNLQIKVESIGTRITSELLEQAFVKNDVLPVEPERRFLGLGLELPMIRELLHSEGGEISLEPYEMGGVRFRVILPQS